MADSAESLPLPLFDATTSSNLRNRLMQRFDRAGRAFDRRTAATRPARQRPRLMLVGDPATLSPGDREVARERACLRAVFHELGDAHRRYRRQTGNSLSPALRAATAAFKLEPSMLSLLPVAAFLDELGILAW